MTGGKAFKKTIILAIFMIFGILVLVFSQWTKSSAEENADDSEALFEEAEDVLEETREIEEPAALPVQDSEVAAEEIEEAETFEVGESVQVSDWNEFITALSNAEVKEITFVKDIERTAEFAAQTYNLGGISRSLKINGNNHTLIIERGHNTASTARGESPLFLESVPEETVLEVTNLKYNKQFGPTFALFTQKTAESSNNWKVKFQNVNAVEGNNNQAGLIQAENAYVEFYGNNYIRGNGTEDVVSSKSITIKNGVTVEADVSKPNKEDKYAGFSTQDFLMEEHARLIYNSTGQVWGIRTNNFTMKEQAAASLKAAGTSTNAVLLIDNNGVINIEKASLNIVNEGKTYSNTAGHTRSYSDSSGYSYGIFGKISEVNIREAQLNIKAYYNCLRAIVSCDIDITDGSSVDLYSTNGSGLGIYYDTSTSTNADIEGNLNIDGTDTEVNVFGGDSSSSAVGSTIYIEGHNSKVNVLNGAKFTVLADEGKDKDNANNSALQLQGSNAVISVKNKSVMKLWAAASSGSTNPVLRFRMAGGMTLDIDNAEVYVESEGGSSNTIRAYGGANKVLVRNGGYLSIVNPGDGKTHSGTAGAYNTGIRFISGGSKSDPDVFSVSGKNNEGKNSAVEINASYGPAIFSNSSAPIEIEADEAAVFEAYGNTHNTNSTKNGTIHCTSGAVTFTIEGPEYFDFKNGNLNGPAVVSSGAASKFRASNTSFSLWKLNADWNLNPHFSVNNIYEMILEGKNFVNISKIDDKVKEVFEAEYENSKVDIASYNRISSNNARPIVDDLRITTDADKTVYGHVSIPEGRGQEPRDAFTGEVYVSIEVYGENGQSLYGELVGTTIGADENGGLSVYGLDEARGGIFKIDLPKYLKEGQTVKVIGAWRGELAESLAAAGDSVYNVLSHEDDIMAESVTTQHVVPPTVLTIDDIDESALLSDEEGRKLFNIKAGTISGSSETEGAYVHLYHNGEKVADAAQVEEGKWQISTLDIDFTDGDILSIALMDTNIANGLEDVDRDYLSSRTRMNGGNENPAEAVQFHDMTFAGRMDIKAGFDGELQLFAPEVLDFGSQKISAVSKSHKVTNMGKGTLGVLDLGTTKAEWKMFIKMDEKMTLKTDRSVILNNPFSYIYNGQVRILEEGDSVLIGEGKNADGKNFYDLYSDKWYDKGGDGLYLNVPAGTGQIGGYEGSLTWTLLNGPDGTFQQ